MTTVNIKAMACNEPGFVRGDEHDPIRNLFRKTQSTERDSPDEFRLDLVSAGEASQHSRVRGTGRNDVHANPRAREFKRGGFGDPFHRMLCGNIDGSECRALVAI